MKNFSDIRNNVNIEQTKEIEESIESLYRTLDLYEDDCIKQRLQEMIDDLKVISDYEQVINESMQTEEYENYSENLLTGIVNSIREGTETAVTLASGEVVEINPEIAKIISQTYDSLNEENAETMIDSMCLSLDEFDAILEFAEQQYNEGK